MDNQVMMEGLKRNHPLGRFVTSPNGMIAIFYDREHQDHFGNDVTRIEFPDSSMYRLVHLTPANANMQRATLYGGAGKFVRLTASSTFNRTQETTWIDIANFKVWWQNGQIYKVMGPHGSSEAALIELLKNIKHDDCDAVIIDVLSYIQYRKHHWQYKQRRVSRYE